MVMATEQQQHQQHPQQDPGPQQPLPALSSHPASVAPAPPVPSKDAPPLASSPLQGSIQSNQTIASDSSSNQLQQQNNSSISSAYPPRSTSIQIHQATNFSRPVGRKPLPEPQATKPGRYHGGRKSSGVHPIVNVEKRHSHTSSAPSTDGETSAPSRNVSTPDTNSVLDEALPPTQELTHRPHQVHPGHYIPQAMSAEVSTKSPPLEQPNGDTLFLSDAASQELVGEPGPTIEEPVDTMPQLHYPAQPYGHHPIPEIAKSMESLGRPRSLNTLGSGSGSMSDGSKLGTASHRNHLSTGAGSPSPSASPMLQPQSHLSIKPFNDRPTSYIDLLQTPYAQQVAPAPNMDNSFLRSAVGANASLLSSSKTLEMYRANVKKQQDPAIQYEFAIFLIQAAMEIQPEAQGQGSPTRAELVREARNILQRLADRSYPFAQYYLADGYFSGLFSKGKEDYDRAFPLFVAASKRGHAESSYRAALCYEFGWGCRTDYAKAAKFYETAASKNHPGAATRLGLACVHNTMGLSGQYRQGVKWLKRAAESADRQYNAAPYELAKLHENGFGDDIFKDPEYAAQLYTQSANLGHPEANLVMGKAYEHGLLNCPQDAALSIHFYTNAAEGGDPEGMMSLCAWYLFGAEPVLEQNENEAFEWAKKAADLEYAKAEYAVGYFKEAGIGCKQDSLEANNWYWRAAQQGEERAKQRIAAINSAVSGGSVTPNSTKTQTDSSKSTKKGLFSKLGR